MVDTYVFMPPLKRRALGDGDASDKEQQLNAAVFPNVVVGRTKFVRYARNVRDVPTFDGECEDAIVRHEGVSSVGVGPVVRVTETAATTATPETTATMSTARLRELFSGQTQTVRRLTRRAVFARTLLKVRKQRAPQHAMHHRRHLWELRGAVLFDKTPERAERGTCGHGVEISARSRLVGSGGDDDAFHGPPFSTILALVCQTHGGVKNSASSEEHAQGCRVVDQVILTRRSGNEIDRFFCHRANSPLTLTR